MDEPNAGAKPDPKDLEPRPPLEADLVALCRELNQRGARYERMKAVTHREKDAADLVFLRYWFKEREEEPPKSNKPRGRGPEVLANSRSSANHSLAAESSLARKRQYWR